MNTFTSATGAVDMDIDASPLPCPPPRIASRPPAVDVPRHACDCHAHIFEQSPLYPYVAKRRYTPSSAGLQMYRETLAALGLSRAVIVQPAIYLDNQVTEDAIETLNVAGIDTRGIALLDQDPEDRTIERLHRAGFRGVRFHLRNPESLDTKSGLYRRIDRIAARVVSLGWHVQLHLNCDDLPALDTWLRSLPCDVVIDHFGRLDLAAGIAGDGFRALLRLQADRISWVKLSAPNRFNNATAPFRLLTPFVRTLLSAAPERLLWGSDWPHSSFHGEMPEEADLLDALSEWVPEPEPRHAILVDNPARLYGFRDKPHSHQ
jgi:2-pyrone-4,6-dicarboxylate lactonase